MADNAGYTLTPISLKVKIGQSSGATTELIANNVNISHRVNDFSMCDISVVARNQSEVVSFKQIFPNLANFTDFTYLAVYIGIKSGDRNTVKDYNMIWTGTLIGISPSFAPGSVSFTLHGVGGLFYSSTLSLWVPGIHPDGAMMGQSFTGETLCTTLQQGLTSKSNLVDLYKITIDQMQKAYVDGSTWLRNAKGVVKGIQIPRLYTDLNKIKVVKGMKLGIPASTEGFNAQDSATDTMYASFYTDYCRNVLSNTSETFWTMYASTASILGGCLVTIGDTVIAAPSYFLNKPVDADSEYDALNPKTNIIHPQDVTGISSNLRPYDAPTRVAAFLSFDHKPEYLGMSLSHQDPENAAPIYAYPSSADTNELSTVTQQENLTGARIEMVPLPQWLYFTIASKEEERKTEGDSPLDTSAKKMRDNATKRGASKTNTIDAAQPAIHQYLRWMYHLKFLAPRSCTVSTRLRLDCVPGLPARVKAPWEAFDVDGYVMAVNHSISTDSASTSLQMSHVRFVTEKVDIPPPLHPDAPLKSAITTFNNAARGK